MATLDPGRVSHGEWSGDDVSLDEVLNQLNRLRAEFAARGAGDFELPHPRNSVMNLVVVAADGGRADHAAEVGEQLGVKHPSRTIVIHPRGGEGDRIDARIRSHAHELVSGAPVQYEEVRLDVWGTRARLRSLIEPLLAPDVRTHLWWLGTPPWDADDFKEVLPGIDTLIVDSADFERPYENFLQLAQVAASVAEPSGVADFEWVRLHPWREALASAFAPPHRLGLLRGINALGLEYAGQGRANRGSTSLMAGWMIESLHWELRSASAGHGGLVRAHYQAPHGHPVEIAGRSVPASDAVPDGTLMSVRLEAAAGGKTARAELLRDREGPRRATLMLWIGDDEPIRHEFLLSDLDDAAVLSILLAAGRRDAVYLRSLRAAAQLLSTFK
jgi:glucose-6-phosphate dehydrogenase assembly protein OpcA